MTTEKTKQEAARVVGWLRESSATGTTDHELETISLRQTRRLRPIPSPHSVNPAPALHTSSMLPAQLRPNREDAFPGAEGEQGLSETAPMLSTLPSFSEASAEHPPAPVPKVGPMSYEGEPTVPEWGKAKKLALTSAHDEGMRCGMVLCDRYLLEAYLGSAPTGEMYQVLDQRQGWRYLCKVYPLSKRRDSNYMRSFVKAFKQQERLLHPNILKACALEYEPVLRVPIALYSWTQGESLLTMLSNHSGTTPLLWPEELRSVLSQLCSALAYLDATGVPFVGLDPRLVRLHKTDGAWRVRLQEVVWAGVGVDTDTVECQNISAATKANTRKARKESLHTIDPFVAPEMMYREQPATPASTVYALGVLCFRLMLGDQPLALERREAPDEDSHEAEVKRILLQATQPDQRRRFDSVGAFWERFEKVLPMV